MVGSVRERMIDTTSELLARRGLQSTTFPAVLALSGAPRGSIYHHFPGGRGELIDAALKDFTAHIVSGLKPEKGLSAVAYTEQMVMFWRAAMLRRDCEASCPVAASVLASGSREVESRCRESIDQMLATITQGYRQCGLPQATAQSLAALVFASMQGAMMMARAAGAIERFDIIGRELIGHARALSGASPS